MTDLHADAFDPASYDPDVDGPTALDREAVPSLEGDGPDLDYYYGEDDLDDDDDFYEG